MRNPVDLIAICEKDGEESIRKQLNERKRFSQFERPVIEEWLRRKNEEQSASERQKTLNIAQEANAIAQDAAITAARSARWAKIAAIIAAIAAIISSVTTIVNALLTKK